MASAPFFFHFGFLCSSRIIFQQRIVAEHCRYPMYDVGRGLNNGERNAMSLGGEISFTYL